MYDLGEYFRPELDKAIANPQSIIKGNKYRITILTESLIRFEYNNEGVFNDMPTELVWYRNFPKPEFTLKEDKNYIEITTKYFKISYTKEENFDSGKINPSKNLVVKLNDTDRFWYYNHPEVRNIGTPGHDINIKEISKAKKLSDIKLDKGLYSFDG